MICLGNEERFLQASSCLCPSILKMLSVFSTKLCSTAQEIRLRVNRPLAIVCTGNTYYLTKNGGLTSTPIKNAMLSISHSEIMEVFHNICNFSVYAKQSEIVNGYVTMQGGHRAGICGTAVIDNNKITNIRDISSVNIRISREYIGCAKSIFESVKNFEKGVLICGAPCSGKTTVLRDIARMLSTDYAKNVSLIDERGEIAGTNLGVFQNDIGMCDVYDCYNKSDAIIQAVRSMAPDYIVCDEIGTLKDVDAIAHSLNSGVSIIASIHTNSKNELKNKANIKQLISIGAFNTLVFLSNRNNVGNVSEIIRAGDLFDT